MSLLRHPEYCVLGSGGAKACRGPADAEARFNELSVEERSRAPEETLVNVASRRRRAAAAGVNPADAGANELIVVTILVAAEGRLSLPRVSNLEELQGALRKLAALPRSAVQAVEVIWTPQEAGDVLTRDEATRMYPKLNSL